MHAYFRMEALSMDDVPATAAAMMASVAPHGPTPDVQSTSPRPRRSRPRRGMVVAELLKVSPRLYTTPRSCRGVGRQPHPPSENPFAHQPAPPGGQSSTEKISDWWDEPVDSLRAEVGAKEPVERLRRRLRYVLLPLLLIQHADC